MADIRITHPHALSQDDARRAAQQVADQLAQDYDVAVEWNGDVMQFERTGVAGSLTLAPNEAQIELRLGLLFKAFAPAIEQKLAVKMRKVFG